MRIDKVREHLQQHPEAAAPSNYLFGWDAIRQMFEPPPEIRAVLEMLRSAKRSDVIGALALATEFLGREPDALLLPILMDEFADPASSVVPVVLWGLLYHRERLASDPARWYTEQAEVAFRTLQLRPGHRVLQALRSSSASCTAALRDELRGAVALAEGDGCFGLGLVRAVEERVYLENRRLGLTRKLTEDELGRLREKVESLEELAEVYGDALADVADPGAVDAYRGIEDGLLLDRLVSQASLSSREREVLNLCRRGFEPDEIGIHLGISTGTVYVLLGRVRAKLAVVA
jgi:DNA-binding CsgD family transcriptional regulator